MVKITIINRILIGLFIGIPMAMAEVDFSSKVLKKAIEIRQHALLDNTAYNIIESLTTEVGSRLAGSKGDARAVAWAQKKFKSLGFDKIWIEPVVFPAWKRISESAQIVQPFPQPLRVTALGFSVSTAVGGITAEVIAFETVEDLEQTKVGSLRGKIVFIKRRMEAHRDGHGYSVAVKARRSGASLAAERGAVAVLIRSIGTDSDRLPHTGVMRYTKGISKIPAAALSNPDADLLQRQLNRGNKVTVTLNLQTEEIPTYTSHNVIAEITGSKYPEQIIALGAHLDSWDLGTGAIDDASGVGIVMAAAHLIAQLAQPPERTIRVILFANEETGLWGGKSYRDNYLGQIKQHIVVAESDFGAGKIYQIDASVKASSWQAIVQISQVLAPLGIKLGTNKSGAGPDFSPLKKHGVAAIALKQDGTKYFDWHHTANDTFDKVDAAAIAQNVAAYSVMIYLVSQMDGDFGSPLSSKK